MAELSPVSSCGLSTSNSVLPTGKKLVVCVHRTGPFSSGNWMSFRRSALPIHFRKIFFVPETRTGVHPSPINGLIAPRRRSSAWNQSAHSGTTGSLNRSATRYSINVGPLSHRTVRLPSRSAPGRVGLWGASGCFKERSISNGGNQPGSSDPGDGQGMLSGCGAGCSTGRHLERYLDRSRERKPGECPVYRRK